MKNRILIIEDVQEFSMNPDVGETIMKNCNVNVEFGKVGTSKTIPIVDSWPESLIKFNPFGSEASSKF